MECVYCTATLKGFADSRTVVLQGHKIVACRDIDACNARVDKTERARTHPEEAA